MTKVNAVYGAMKNFPRNKGASAKDIHRYLSRHDKNKKSRRSLASVKKAIVRGVAEGKVRVPKGWKGFTDLGAAGRPQRTPHRKPVRKYAFAKKKNLKRKGGHRSQGKRRNSRSMSRRHGRRTYLFSEPGASGHNSLQGSDRIQKEVEMDSLFNLMRCVIS